jgi:hypothetical protein
MELTSVAGMMDLYLRKIIHPQAHENYRVILKREAGWRIAAQYRWARPTTRSRMRNGMIQINAAARLPPKEFAQ